ncbi:MAG: toll/interleukin-1 receptor domain-containing protein [Betaproteobacteria bacterium]|nr:toll/interleukin-1 receptor domain-containing protein [Betaproteobacteria bacterium]
MDGIFISYRRDDSAGYAGRLYDRLASHFGAQRVFMDVEGIEPGVDFIKAIEDAVGSCRVLIVIIGDEWTTATDGTGHRRLDDPNDFIRLETSVALKRGIRVVPVLVGAATMPRAEELPEELQSLTRRQAIEISHKQWDASIGELIRTLERILGASSAPEPSPAQAGATGTSAPVTDTPAHGPCPLPASAPRLRCLPARIGTLARSATRPSPPPNRQRSPKPHRTLQ